MAKLSAKARKALAAELTARARVALDGMYSAVITSELAFDAVVASVIAVKHDDALLKEARGIHKTAYIAVQMRRDGFNGDDTALRAAADHVAHKMAKPGSAKGEPRTARQQQLIQNEATRWNAVAGRAGALKPSKPRPPRATAAAAPTAQDMGSNPIDMTAPVTPGRLPTLTDAPALLAAMLRVGDIARTLCDKNAKLAPAPLNGIVMDFIKALKAIKIS